MKRLLVLIVSVAATLIFSAVTSWATSASISVSGNEGAIPLIATANFTSYRHCDPNDPNNCWNVDSGTLQVTGSEGSYLVGGDGSASYSTTLDGGSMSQGAHTFTATAVDSEGVVNSSQAVITIDNTPLVYASSRGKVEGLFDPSGTVIFKERVSGYEGHLIIYGPEGMTTSRGFEGTSISWKYSDMFGHELDAGDLPQGTHAIRAVATAANGASSEDAFGTYIIDNTPQLTAADMGQVEGRFDPYGTVVFKERASGSEGHLVIYGPEGMTTSRGFEGTSISWKYSDLYGHQLDAGDLPQGTHAIRAVATAANGASSGDMFGTYIIDNTPQLTAADMGQVEGWFDPYGTVMFKERASGSEGHLVIYGPEGMTTSPGFEGTSISWKYSDMFGHKLNADTFQEGTHAIIVNAYAANGASSGDIAATFEIKRTNRAKSLGSCNGICPTRTFAGNPINFSTGNKFQPELDIMLEGCGLPLGFSRYYNSQSTLPGIVGHGWTSTFSEYLTSESGKVILHQADGGEVHFIDNGQGKFISETDKVRVVEPSTAGYSLKEADGRELSFDASGRLLQIADRNGDTQTLVYSAGRLSSVDDNFGRRLEFAYGTDGRLATLSTPIGRFGYTYDGQGNVSIVTRPDQTTKIYLYEDPNDAHNLTGILNEKGVRSLTVQYDNQDRAVLSQGAGGTKGVSIVYDNNYVRRVTDSLGRTTTFKLWVEKGIARVKEVSGEGCGSCNGSLGEKYEFNDRLYVTQSIDALGVVTAYTYDDHGNVLTRKEAAGTPEERTTTYAYHPSFNLVTSITRSSVASPGQNTTTTFTYDERGNLLSNTESGFNGSVEITRTTTYTYNAYGQVTSINGPRTDLNDVTTFEYYPNTADQGLNRGRLKKITDPLGFETQFSQYNAFGKPGSGTDPNNIATSYTYDSMGRLKTRSVDGLTTSFSYDELGNLVLSRYPDGREFTYHYTDKGWLDTIMALPGSINYVYDTEGNRLREEIKDNAATVLRYTEFEYDNKNRLQKTIYPDSNYEERSYDAKGNLLVHRDQKGQNTSYAYDPLNRLISVAQPGSVITGYGYDKLDNLIRVTDAESHSTIYTYDDLGRLLSTSSPDTNLTVYSYDPAGNLLSKADANGIATNYTYDAVNRLTRISYPDSAQNVVFSYDQGVNGKGWLTGMADPSGTYTYTYDAIGNLVTERRVSGGLTFTTQYTYSQGGPLRSVTYPSGRIVSYDRDSAGRITRVKDTIGGTARTLADNVGFLPFGPMQGLTYGNGMVETRGFDEMYRIQSLNAGNMMKLSYTYDPVGNILDITNGFSPSRSQSFTYDSLERLISARGIYGVESYAYDKVGNRLQKSQNGLAENYGYIPGSNKIQAITGANPLSVVYDSNGNTVQMGNQGFVYNQDNRLIQASVNGTTVGTYIYNGKGERTKKVADGKTTLFIWDKDGNLIGETDETGATIREYVYLEGRLLSMIASESRDVQIRVSTSKGRYLANVNVSAYTQTGAYTGKSARTNNEGIAVFQYGLLADGKYKFRADYLSYQFWSPVIVFPATNSADVSIGEETAAVTVNVAGEAKAGVQVYLFNGSGTYLGLYQTTDTQGKSFFNLPIGKAFKFRADYLGNQYWSPVLTLRPGAQNAVAISAGGGTLSVTLKKDEVSLISGASLSVQSQSGPVSGSSCPIPGAKLYLFSQSGAYLGLYGTGDQNGMVSYMVSGGTYKIRADYLGYQFWSDLVGVSGDAQLAFTIPHENVEITVEGDNAGRKEPKADVPCYLFTSSGVYVNVSAKTNESGKVGFSVPNKEYRVRADYLGSQVWSDVFTWEDKKLSINEGVADIAVTNMGLPLQGVYVYAFAATGSYLNLSCTTDAEGKVTFRMPEGRYKFRADYMGSQYWSGDIVIIPHVTNPVPISTGGGVFTLHVEKSPGVPIVGADCYLFSGSGAYLGAKTVTSGNGEAGFNLADGSYKIRIDYLGRQFWTGLFNSPASNTLTQTIPHQDVTMTVMGDCNGRSESKAGMNCYLFTESDSYVNVSAKTDEQGRAVFNVPPGEYKIRADYLGSQYWSEVFNQTSKQILIHEGMADVIVGQNGTAVANTNVYVFSSSGAYLDVHGVTGAGGVASFRLPGGTYRFRGDYQGGQFWVTESVAADQVKTVNLDTGGGLFTLKVETAPGAPLADKPVYVFTPSGSYINMTAHTDAQGEVSFALSSGWYRFRLDYSGYQFWCEALQVPSTLSYTLSVPHKESTISVTTFYTGAMTPNEGANVYLFTENGSYLDLNAKTDAQGQVKFKVPDRSFKVRVDYLGGQYWSEPFEWQDRDVVIDEGMLNLHVTWNGTEVSGAGAYLFTNTGSYLGRTAITDAQGRVQFTLPAKPYKFRIDYNGHQYWTSLITPIEHQPLGIEVPLEQLALMPTNDPAPSRYDGEAPAYVDEGLKVASLGSLMGILTQSTVAQATQQKVYYYLTDHLGTPQKMIDATGQMVWSADYKPFGEVLSGVTKVQNQFRFPGQFHDKETALHYNYNRYYDVRIESYSTPDPISIIGKQNSYTYAYNSPMNWTDVFGLLAERGHSSVISVSLTPFGADERIIRKVSKESNKADSPLYNPISMWDNARHGGSDVDETLAGARQMSFRTQYRELDLAVATRRLGDFDSSYSHLAKGLHIVADRTVHKFATFPGHFLFKAVMYFYRDYFPRECDYDQAVYESRKYIQEYIRLLGYNPFIEADSILIPNFK